MPICRVLKLWVTIWAFPWKYGWLYGWLNESMYDYMGDSIKVRVISWLYGWLRESMGDCMRDCMNPRVSICITPWIHGLHMVAHGWLYKSMWEYMTSLHSLILQHSPFKQNSVGYHEYQLNTINKASSKLQRNGYKVHTLGSSHYLTCKCFLSNTSPKIVTLEFNFKSDYSTLEARCRGVRCLSLHALSTVSPMALCFKHSGRPTCEATWAKDQSGCCSRHAISSWRTDVL